MTFSTRMTPLAMAVLAALGHNTAGAADQALPQVDVHAQAERADGPVQGYRATRSATFTKTDTPLKEVPASVSIVSEDLIDDMAMQSIADVMRYVPGTTAHQGEGNRDQVVLRGNATTADFFVDGIRDDAQTFRDLYNLERVEVLKGPGGMAFGRGGAGGLVNRVTRKPVFGPIGEASITVGSHQQWRGTADIGNKLGNEVAWRLNAMAETAESFRDGVDLKRYAANPTLTLMAGPQTALTLGFEHLHDERTADRGFPSDGTRPFDADPASFFGNADQSASRSTVNGFSAVLDHDFGAGVQLKNSFRATRYDKFYQNVYARTAVDTNNDLTLAAYNNANERTNVFNQTDLTARLALGGFEHTLLAGVEVGHQNSASQRQTGFFGSSQTATVSASAPQRAVTGFRPNGSDADSEVQADIAAVYVQDQMALTKSFKVLAGLRYDHFKVSLDDRRTLTTATDLARTDNEFSPRLGLIWSPNAASTYYASYSYSFLPSAEQLSLTTATDDLAPEKAKNYEVGARWDLTPKLTLSAAAFRLDRDDVRVADPVRTGFFVKTGQQRTEGVEIGLQGEVSANWQIYAGYANLDGRITKDTTNGAAGKKIGLVPENMLSVWNRVSFANGWAAGLGIVHQDESFTSFTNTVKLPSFTRADGALYYTLAGGKTRLALNVENLLNKKYFPTANGDNNISPGAPRNARLTLNTTF